MNKNLNDTVVFRYSKNKEFLNVFVVIVIVLICTQG